MRKTVVYAYLENLKADEEFDEDISLHFCDENILQFEIDHVGIESWMRDCLREHPTGYYRIEVEIDTDSEYVDGYKVFDYDVVVGFPSIEKSLKARFLFFKKERIDPVVRVFQALFDNNWFVSYYDGPLATRTQGMRLHSAFWLFVKSISNGRWNGVNIARY